MNVETTEITPHELQERVLQALVSGVTIFGFMKKDGTTRHAIGTKHPGLLPHPALALDGVADLLDEVADPVMYDQVGEMHLDRIHTAAEKHHYPETPVKARKVNIDTVPFYDIPGKAWKSYNADSLQYLLYLSDDGFLSTYAAAE